MSEQRETGNTRTQGWEVGVRRTLPLTPEQAWAALTTPPGLAAWFGDDEGLPLIQGERFVTADGTRGEVRSVAAGSMVRMTWQPPDWPEPSTLQVRVLPAATGATISVHHERLPDGAQGAAMRERWQAAITDIERLTSGTGGAVRVTDVGRWGMLRS